jgi:hypothetical protein
MAGLTRHAAAYLLVARTGPRHFLGRCRSNSRAAKSASLPQLASSSHVHRLAETSRLASERLELCLLSAYAAW